MNENDDAEMRRWWAKSQASQQRHADNQITAFRRYWENLSPDDKVRAKELLKQQVVIQEELRLLCLFPRIEMQSEEVDDEGEVVNCEGCTMNPDSMLKAIAAWESGEPFVPMGGYI